VATTNTTLTEDDAGAREKALTLLVMSPPFETSSHVLPRSGTVTLGRSSKCSIRIDDPAASREHARLHIEAERLSIEDLGSANGTRVRDVAIGANERTPLLPGEAVGIGGTVVIVLPDRTASGSRSLWSHVYFGARVEEECARAAQSNGSLGLARLRFTAEPIKVVAPLLRALAAGQGIAQYGPKDFEVLFVDGTEDEASSLMGRLVHDLRLDGLDVRTSMAWFPRDGRSFDALIAAANSRLKATVVPVASLPEPAGMRRVHEMATKVASSQINVLIQGETGAGKDVLARLIHQKSPRAQKPFLPLNCAGLPETLLESELFGHAKGTFTGATTSKIGLLAAADGGTVFLDEIGDMPLSIQARLLRVIEDRQIRPVGSLQSIEVNVRFLSATNKDLEEAVAKREFRQDLLFRLNGLSLYIPPLRQRRDEIPVLANTFLNGACREMGRAPVPSLSDEAMDSLLRHSWSGNIRELKNVIERALVLCEGPVILPEHLELRAGLAERMAERPTLASGRVLPELTDPVKRAERQRILDALEACASNQTRAAQMLNMPRRTFVSKLEYYKIPRPQKDSARDRA
jgi:DNA-binding NtrC family response regulator